MPTFMCVMYQFLSLRNLFKPPIEETADLIFSPVHPGHPEYEAPVPSEGEDMTAEGLEGHTK